MKKNLTIKILFLGLILSSCKERFHPDILDTNPGLLVVDGFLNNGSETTTIRLSKTSKLDAGTAGKGELNAQLYVEDENGSILYYFQEVGDGNYIVPGMNLDFAKKYRLKINTTNGKQYASDVLTVKQTPPIDSVNWRKQNDGVGIYINTHDPNDNTKYYRWEYTETWEYSSNNFSYFVWENSMVRLREPSEFVYYCWKTLNSTNMMLGSTAKLSRDLIFEYPVTLLPLNSEQISKRYSIIVRQFALTKECFEYLENVKKITEQMGSIFDAQPSQLTGNIHCLTNPDETVLGYATAGTKSEQRIFISYADVLPWPYSYNCEPTRVVPPILDSMKFYFNGGYTPVDESSPPGSGYNANVTECVDCTSRGGTTVRPDFW